MKWLFQRGKRINAYIVCFLAFALQVNANEPQTLSNNVEQNSSANGIDVERCRLSNYEVSFDVKDGSRSAGKAKRTLKYAENTMRLHTDLRASLAFLKFTQSEDSTLSDYQSSGFISTEYIKTRKKPFKSKETTRYAIEQPMAEKHATTETSEAIFDPLAVYDHLRELVCSGLNKDITLKVQDENEVDSYTFIYKGEQTLELPIGSVETLLVVRVRSTSTRETAIWFDKNNNYLPVKIQQTKDGEIQATLVANAINS